MPFLRAAQQSQTQNAVIVKKQKTARTIRTAEDLSVAQIVQKWIAYDDQTTAQELIRLGLA